MRGLFRSGLQLINDFSTRIVSEFQSADLSIFHQFAPPPTGGGHQFLRALWIEINRHGLKVENNSISRKTRACLLNSFNFDENRLNHLRRSSVLYVHRVDGPIDLYRGRNDQTDQRIWMANQQFAEKTIFQSQYSFEKHLELGMNFKNPVIILNAADPAIFSRQGRINFSRERKAKIIASSWSDNLNKGASFYQWLDEHLDWEQFDFTFVGRSPVKFKNIRVLAPVDSNGMASLFRANDIYITASRYDPCSNSLIEALTCGLPALYLNSGGHPEIVGQAGFGFDTAEEIPALLNQLVNEYEMRQQQISNPEISEVTNAYLKTLELA